MKKRLIKLLLPDFTFNKISDIDYGFFGGAKLIIFDVDNTLFFPESVQTNKEILNWLLALNGKYQCVLLSNSKTRFKRAKKISDMTGCPVFLSKYKKPSGKLFEEICKRYNLKGNKFFVVGDIIFTDIIFGNLNGAVTVLVKPITSKESFFIKLARWAQNIILFYL